MTTTAAQHQTIDVEELVDAQKLSLFVIGIFAFSFLSTLADGYNLQAAAFAGSGIIHDWHLNRDALAPLFSAGLFGMLFGAPLLGEAGDRFGRKTGLIAALLIFGISTLLSAGASSLTWIIALRFIAGFGLGGLVPNVVAIMAEFMPKRIRATMMILVFMGITLGGTLPALVLASLVPSFGWRALFVVGGCLGLVLALAAIFALPESMKFSVLHGRRRAELVRLAEIMDPTLNVTGDAEFRLPAHGAARSAAPLKQLFSEGLAWITPLVWVLFFTCLMSNYFLSSWMPTLLRDFGLSVNEIALTASMFYFGGLAGGLVISGIMGRWGIWVIGALFLIGCPAVAAIGIAGLPHLLLMAAVFMSGFAVLGVQIGLNAVTGLIYPTAARSSGNGWASAVGRVGGIVGPLVAGWLLAMHVSTQQLFYTPLIPLGIGAIASVVLARLCYTRFQGNALEEERVAAQPAPLRHAHGT